MKGRGLQIVKDLRDIAMNGDTFKKLVYPKIAASRGALQTACQLLTIFLVFGTFFLTGCGKRYYDYPSYLPFEIGDFQNGGMGRFKTSYIIEQIDNHYQGTDPGPIAVTTMVNLDDLYSTSSFGRMYSEQLMSELAMRGYQVVELRHADSLQFLTSAGEFGLSRDMSSLRQVRNLGGVVVGTYSVSPERVYVNVRLIEPSNSMIVSAASVEMGRSEEISRMLRQGGMNTALERIPVRHIGLTTYPMAMGGSWSQRVYDLEELGPAPMLPKVAAKK